METLPDPMPKKRFTKPKYHTLEGSAATRHPPILQVAALCYRRSAKGLRILLITSRDTGRWIIPKGWPMRNRSEAQAAAREAWEEAGLRGVIDERSIGFYTYSKKVGPGRSAAESIAVITRHGSERIVRYAFEYARKHGRKKVSIIHKANILKMSNGLFLEVGKEVAKQFPDIESDDVIVDAACMKLVLMPERFDVIVTMNLFGDILSDLIAGLVGGLGVSPGANLGERAAIFEAVHGSAPDIAGQGIANPSALLMAALMMLEHLGQNEPATRLRAALFRTLADPRTRTRDLGGQANTQAFTQAVIAQL